MPVSFLFYGPAFVNFAKVNSNFPFQLVFCGIIHYGWKLCLHHRFIWDIVSCLNLSSSPYMEILAPNLFPLHLRWNKMWPWGLIQLRKEAGLVIVFPWEMNTCFATSECSRKSSLTIYIISIFNSCILTPPSLTLCNSTSLLLYTSNQSINQMYGFSWENDKR